MKTTTRCLFVLLVMFSFRCDAAAANTSTKPQQKTSVDKILPSMFGVHAFQQAAISPDGTHVAWVESATGSDSGKSLIYIAALNAPTKTTRITAGINATTHEEHDIAWSRDSKHLVFLSDAASPRQLQVFTVDAAGGIPKRLTHLRGFLSGPQWSPDDKSVAVLFAENASEAASGPTAAKAADQGVVTEESYEQRLAIVDVTSARIREISPKDLYVYEFDWSPDSKSFVATAAYGNGDNNWYIASLVSFDAANGSMKKLVEKPGMQIAVPRWSPNGQLVAFIGGLMSDEGSVGGEVYTVSSAGGPVTDATPGMKISAGWLQWSSDSNGLIFSGIADGGGAIARLDFGTKAIAELWRGEERIFGSPSDVSLSLAQDGKTSAVVRQSFSQPPEVWAGPMGRWNQLTHRNAALHPMWGKSVSLHWTTNIGAVQGWLIYPKDFDPAKKYPLVVRVHGGPSWAIVPYWPTRWDFSMALPSQGYFVLQPNPRGSYGEGENFTAANRKDFGGGDFQDILAGVDKAIQSAPIDPNRIGLTGWSYGGYMTMWGVTQTNRFRAAVAGAGVANLQSYYGENKIDQWLIPFFGASVYDDPAVYYKSSPINFIKNVKTPTLVVVGDSDGECPPPQSYEFWHALRTFGVPTEMVIYPHEGHHFSKPADSRDVMERAVAWFHQYMNQ